MPDPTTRLSAAVEGRSTIERLSFRSIAPASTVIALLAVAAIVLVASTLRRPDVPSYPPTVPDPREVGERLVGPVIYTVDAPEQEVWHYFDFSRGSVVTNPGPREWDLAFQRFSVIANGGDGFAGEGGVVELGEVAFEAVTRAPATGYVGTEAVRDSTNPAIRRWYDYGFTSHLLTPKPRVYVVRTADGRFAKIQLLSYYCPGARPGCLTFRYVYQGGRVSDLSARP